ncbi:MAG: hypothetical protein DI537_34650 [Stutzerimonas stutzeri]|nr:MAG: hypothetical protein DI537_34650 [Stutzerimonas stutzeri]
MARHGTFRLAKVVGATAIALGWLFTTQKLDEEYVQRGKFSGYINTKKYRDAGLSRPADYECFLKYKNTTFPQKSEMRLRLPMGPPPLGAGVGGILGWSYGDYHGNALMDPLTAVRVDAIGTFRSRFKWELSGSTNGNLLHEFYLTGTANDHNTQYAEIGLFAHAPATTRAYHAAGTLVGTWTDGSGRAWVCRRQPVTLDGGYNGWYYMFMPTGDVFSADLDLANLLTWLRANVGTVNAIDEGAAMATKYINGMVFGWEPITDAGTNRVRLTSWTPQLLAA